MDTRDLAFGKTNFILLAIALVIIVVGFVLMSGGKSTAETFNPDTFGAMHIKVAPLVTFIGYIAVIVAIVYKPKEK